MKQDQFQQLLNALDRLAEKIDASLKAIAIRYGPAFIDPGKDWAAWRASRHITGAAPPPEPEPASFPKDGHEECRYCLGSGICGICGGMGQVKRGSVDWVDPKGLVPTLAAIWGKSLNEMRGERDAARDELRRVTAERDALRSDRDHWRGKYHIVEHYLLAPLAKGWK